MRLFVSYRRGDTAGRAGRLYDALAARFERSVFMDVAGSIPPGRPFPAEIRKAIESADVLVAVIGETWLSCTNDAGERRLDEPDDLLRVEIATALELGVPVIPVLVANARAPAAEDLPADLRPLHEQQAMAVRDADWDHHCSQLITAIEEIEQRTRWPAKVLAIGLAALLFVTLAIVGEGRALHPWQAVWLIGPLAMTLVVHWRYSRFGPRKNRRVVKALGSAVAFVVACAVAMSSPVLESKQSLDGFRDVQRSWLVPNWAGDWRYFFVRERASTDLVAVTIPSPFPAQRLELAAFVEIARRNRAKAVALALDLDDEPAPVQDGALRSTLESVAKAANGTYVIVCRPRPDQAGVNVWPAEGGSLDGARCVRSRSGHVDLHEDPDGIVRAVPLDVAGGSDALPMSVKLVHALRGEDTMAPTKRLLHFTRPAAGVPCFEFDRLSSRTSTTGERCASFQDVEDEELAGSTVVVGFADEVVDTPHGRLPTALVHAYAVHSLLERHELVRTSWWASLPILFPASYLLLLLYARNASRRHILAVAATSSFGLAAVSAITMLAWSTWVPIVYAVVGVWLLALLVLVAGAADPLRRAPKAS